MGVNAAPQEVVLAEGRAFEGDLVSVEDDWRVKFQSVRADGTPSEVQAIGVDELVRWGHALEARPQTIVVLADGGRLVTAADWSGGAAVRLDGDVVVVLSDTFDEVRLPRANVRGVVFAQSRHPLERERLVERMAGGFEAPEEPSPGPSQLGRGNSDVVLLTNGDRVEGELKELEGGSLTVEMQAGAVKLPLSRVEAVELGGSRQPSAVSRQPKLVVGLRDGSLVFANAVRADDGELALRVGEGVKLSGGSVEDVVALQLLDGPFVYLSDLEPADYRHVPYLNVNWMWTRDRGVSGGPLVVNGKRFLKGIGMHSASRLTYRLNADYRRFDAAVAVDVSAEGRGSVTFGVYVLRDGQWHEEYKSGVVRGGEAPVPVSVDVTGAEGLTLTVDYADRGDEMDRAAWLDARLTKN